MTQKSTKFCEFLGWLVRDFHNFMYELREKCDYNSTVFSLKLWKSVENVHNSDRSYEHFCIIFITPNSGLYELILEGVGLCPSYENLLLVVLT